MDKNKSLYINLVVIFCIALAGISGFFLGLHFSKQNSINNSTKNEPKITNVEKYNIPTLSVLYNYLKSDYNNLEDYLKNLTNSEKLYVAGLFDTSDEEKNNNNFDFVNAVVEKKLSSSLKILKNLKVYKVEPTALVALLAREFRLMYYIKELKDKMNTSEMMSYLSLADWQINKLYNNSMKYTKNELLKNLLCLCKIDLNIKKGYWDKDTSLYGFILENCS